MREVPVRCVSVDRWWGKRDGSSGIVLNFSAGDQETKTTRRKKKGERKGTPASEKKRQKKGLSSRPIYPLLFLKSPVRSERSGAGLLFLGVSQRKTKAMGEMIIEKERASSVAGAAQVRDVDGENGVFGRDALEGANARDYKKDRTREKRERERALTGRERDSCQWLGAIPLLPSPPLPLLYSA